MGNADLPSYGASPSTLAMALVFGTIIVATVAMTIQSSLVNDDRLFSIASNPKSSPLVPTYASVYTMLRQFSIFGCILFFAYICEYHPPFAHSEKYYDRDEFFMLTGLLFFASAFTLHKNDGKVSPTPQKSNVTVNGHGGAKEIDGNTRDGIAKPSSAANDLLNRDQTEEWKGWMQFMFLLYHYLHAEEVYNSIRIMITCYVWMTGFGNFSFFYLKGDFTLVRVLQMLWRLNFLVIFLCLTQGTTYILYYICPLHTYFFFMVYIAMRIAKGVNYTKYGLRIKLMVLGVCIFCLWDWKALNLFELLHFYLPTHPQLGATNGTLWEWYFRTSLDHWSTFLGMIFAANYPIMSYLQRKLEAQPVRQEWMAKGSIGIVLVAIFLWWVTHPFMEPKLSYNQTNAYYGFIPLVTYIYFRNLTPTLRSYSLDLLHQIGKTTLETYLMQHHIWLTSNAKSLLTLIPGWPKVNFLVVSIGYFFLSRRLYRITLFLRGMLMPDDHVKCLKSLFVIFCVIGLSYAYTWTLAEFELNFLPIIGCSALILGLSLYKITTLKLYHMHSDTNANSLRPILGGIASLLMFGFAWRSMAVFGAGKIIPLPASCAVYANEGSWVSISTCNELQKGVSYHEHGIDGFATCNGKNWGWDITESSSLCRFTSKNSKGLKKQLQGQRIVFVGDSITRNVYHALNRALGNTDAGQYDTNIEKHSNIKKEIGNISLEFYWAPYASDIYDVIKEQRTSKPDLIVLGGGAWDRLHQWSAPEDKQAFVNNLVNIKGELNEYKMNGISSVWILPTTINDAALMSEDKKQNMTESKIQEVREISSRNLEDSPTFVLDGSKFTIGRVHESYDGVHYPNDVYDAGAQILANAMDWLVTEKLFEFKDGPHPGKMAQPLLGIMILAISSIGLFFFDSYFGLSYLASFFVRGVRPNGLYEEAFAPLHTKMKLPPIISSQSRASKEGEEFNTLLRDEDETNEDIEMTPNGHNSRGT